MGVTLKELDLSLYVSPSAGANILELARIGYGVKRNCCKLNC